MKYIYSPELQEKAEDFCRVLLPHVKVDRIKCFRSFGTSTKRTIARCHALGKVMQKAMNTDAFYVLEFLAERFDKMGKQDQEKVILHELMHIPKSFGGGFKHHDWVTEKNINKLYKEYENKKRQAGN